MSVAATWTSPDSRIEKTVVEKGTGAKRPYYKSVCTFKIQDVRGEPTSNFLDAEKEHTLTLGLAETAFDRELEKCLLCMEPNERSNFCVRPDPDRSRSVRFALELRALAHHGLIYEWDAAQKYEFAAQCKERGVEVFTKAGRVGDASHLFSRGLKLLAAIPVAVNEAVEAVDGVALKDVCALRALLYNNLATCNLKAGFYESVAGLCDKVLAIESGNVKAMYKKGVALIERGLYDQAKEVLTNVLKYDEGNRAASEKLKELNVIIKGYDKEYSDLVKRMFKT